MGAWLQIVLFISFCEVYLLKQDPEKAPVDVVPDGVAWARYPDGYDVWLGDGSTKQVGEDELILGKTWKLNAERNNGRAAMMGITGMLIHESLTGNPVFPPARRSKRRAISSFRLSGLSCSASVVRCGVSSLAGL